MPDGYHETDAGRFDKLGRRRNRGSLNTTLNYYLNGNSGVDEVIETHGKCIKWRPKSNRCPSKGYPEVLGNGLCMACWDKAVDHKQSARQQLG